MMQRILSAAMQQPDDLVVKLQYIDSNGAQTTRIVSPIRYLGTGRFLGLCLSRCEPRQFYIERCSQVELKAACDYVMPVAIANVG